MNPEIKKLCISVRQVLYNIESCPKHVEGRADSRGIYSSNFLAHEIEIATTMTWHFLSEVEKKLKVAEFDPFSESVPVFVMMNDMLFNQRKYREAITKIINLHYKMMEETQKVQVSSYRIQQVNLLAHLIEILAIYIKNARHDADLSKDEEFSNTIALMKVNIILQLKDFTETEQDIYRDYSIEQNLGENTNDITESRAASTKYRESEQANTETLRKLRRIRTHIGKWRLAIQDFDRKFHSHLETRLDYALCWNRALSAKHFGYAVESYVEKCNKELSESSDRGKTLGKIADKLHIAEKMLLKLEDKSVTLSPRFTHDADTLTGLIKEILPLLVMMCADVSKEKYRSLIGDANIKKYEEIRQLLGEPSNSSAHATEDLSRNKSLHRSERVAKIATLFKLNPKSGSHSRSKSDATNNARMFCVHQDIVTEYEYSFSQTLAMLEDKKFTYVGAT